MDCPRWPRDAWKRGSGRRTQDELRKRRNLRLGSRVQGEAKGAAADAKFGAVLQHGGADAFFFEEGSVGRVEIFQVDEAASNLEQAMVAGNLGIIEGHVGAFTADHGTHFGEGKARAELRATGHCERGCGGRRQIRIVVDRKSLQTSGGRIGASKGRHRRDNRGLIDATLHFHDGRFSAFRAAELNFGMLGEHRVVENVLLPTMNTASLHNSKVARCARAGTCPMVQVWGGGYVVDLSACVLNSLESS
jgi:hypothetical protein